MPVEEKIQLPCPKCGQRIAAPANRGGARAKCPNCQTVFTLPGLRVDAPPPPRNYDGLPPFPVIRIRNLWLWHEVVAIYEDHLLCGKRWLLAPSITEEMCQPAGEPALAKQLFRPKSIAYFDIAEIQEEGLVAAPNSGMRANEFTIHGRKKQRMRFAIQASQVRNPRAILSAVLKERYWLAPGSGFSRNFQVKLLLASAVLFGIAALLLYFARFKPLAACGIGLAGLLGWLGYWRQFRSPMDRKLISKFSASDFSPFRPKPKPIGAPRPPRRSLWLGLALRVLGATYIAVMVSPLTAGLGPVAYRHFHHAKTIILAVWLLVWIPAPLLILAGYRLSRRKPAGGKKGDTRKPIIILRPFEDEAALSLQPAGPLAWLTGIRSKWLSPAGNAAAKKWWRIPVWDLVMLNHPVKLLRMVLGYGVDTAEESLAKFFQKLGPVIVPGRLDEASVTPGARKFSDYAQWQQTVRDNIGGAQAVVVQPGAPSAVRWELEQVRASVEPTRVLLCAVADWRNPHAYEELCMFVRNIFDVELPRAVPFLNRPAFVVFDRNWTPRLQPLSYKFPMWWPFAPDAANLRHSLKSFIQGLQGEKREPPRPLRWARGFLGWTANGTALATGLALVCLPFVGAYFAGLSIIDPSLSIAAQSNNSARNEENDLLKLAPLPPPDEQTKEVISKAGQKLVEAPKKKLTGQKVPYEFELPETMVEVPPENEMMEYSRESPDGRLRLQVVAAPGQEDLSSLPTLRLSKNSVLGMSEGKLESSQTIHQSGLAWIEARIIAKANDSTVREITRGTSGTNGTLIVIVSLNDAADSDPTYLSIADNILNSFRFTR